MKVFFKLFFLIAVLFFLAPGCSKNNDEQGDANFDEQLGNYVQLESTTYKIQSATYSIEDGNLTVLFTTDSPEVFLYFEKKTALPDGSVNISYQSSPYDCFVTFSFENEDYMSIDGSMSISQDNEYTIKALGHLVSESNVDKTFKIYYKGEISETIHNGGGFSDNDFWLGPVFSYVTSKESEGVIHVYCDNDNLGWTASCADNWCHLIDGAGTGHGSFGFITEANLSIVDRSAKIIVTTNDGRTKRARIIQRAGWYQLELSPNSMTFPGFGGTQSLRITVDEEANPNVQWVASCNASWVHLSQTNGSSTEDISITVDRNTSSERVAEIRVQAGTGDKFTVRYCRITQKEGGNSSTCCLIYDGQEIAMSDKWVSEICDLGWIGTLSILYLGCEGSSNNIKPRVELNFSYNGIPTGNIACDVSPYWLQIKVKDSNNKWHDASSGSVSISKTGNTYTVTGSGVADHTSYSFWFEGKLL